MYITQITKHFVPRHANIVRQFPKPTRKIIRPYCDKSTTPQAPLPPKQQNSSKLEDMLAKSINRLADKLDTSTKKVEKVAENTKQITENTIKKVSDSAQNVLPNTGEIIDAPPVVADKLQTTGSIVSFGQRILSLPSDVVRSIGRIIGRIIGTIITWLLGAKAENTETQSPLLKALRRLSVIAAKSYLEISKLKDNTKEDIKHTAKESAIDVVSHSLGSNTGKVVEKVIDIGKGTEQTIEKAKSAIQEPKSMVGNVSKTVGDETMNTVLSDISKTPDNPRKDQ